MKRTDAWKALGVAVACALAVLPALRGLPWLPPIVIIGTVLTWRASEAWPRRDDIRLALVLVACAAIMFAFGWRDGPPWRALAFLGATVVIYAVFTSGLSIQFASGGLINFGHVASMALGAYAVGLLTTAGGWTGPVGFLGAVVVGVLASAVWAFMLGVPTLRLREDYLAITTIAAGEILRIVINNEEQWTRGAAGVQSIPFPFGWSRDLIVGWFGPGLGVNLSVGVAAIATLVLVAWTLNRILSSPWGRLVRAVRDDEDAAAGLGTPVVKIKMQVLVLGSGVAALAGALFAWQRLQLVPALFDPLPTFYAWSILILGGLGSLRGVVAGSAVFWVIFDAPRWLRFEALDSQKLAALQVMIVGLLLMGTILLRPQGLFGDKAQLEVME